MTRRVVLFVTASLALAMLAACGDGSGESAEPSPTSTTTAPTTAAPPTTVADGACPNGGAPVRDFAYSSVSGESVPGVAPRSTSLDIYPPRTGCPAPVVMWVHGGGWQRGDKKNQLADRSGCSTTRAGCS